MKLILLAVCVLGVLATGARAANPVVVLDTSMGTIKIELFEDKAPITVKNFLSYVDDKFYDGTIFHRVIPNFMIQGGGMEPGLKEKRTKDPIKNEGGNGLSNTRGTVAMARTSIPDSATAQFFINVNDNTFLDRNQSRDGVGYAVFGKVIEGMDVVDKIKAVKTGRMPIEQQMFGGAKQMMPTPNVPVEDVVIKSIRRADGK
jgi:cyclophilin family peptidyl-prolyl cis-trans isomerase